MHVALISTCSVAVPPPRYGGTEFVVDELARALTERGHRVTTYATGDSRPAGELRSHYDRPVWPPSSYSELLHAHWSCRDIEGRGERPDVVHVHAPAGLAFAARLDLPTVYTVHHPVDPRLTEFYQCFGDTTFAMISARQSELHVGVPNRRVVHHGIDPRDYAASDACEDYLAFLGRFAPEKGSHIAIDVARAVGTPLVIAGEAHPHELAFFEREMKPRLALEGVRWIGEVGREGKQALLSKARAMLFPIDWEEPFGLVLIESMLCGTPVIAFRRGSVPEIVEDGVTGFVVETADEMQRAIRRIGSLDRAEIRARAVERWSADRMAAQYVTLYEHAIERRRSAR